MIDTGASLDLANSNILQKYPNLAKYSKIVKKLDKIHPDSVYLPNGDMLKIEGQITFEANIGTKPVTLSFYLIKNFAYDFLMGYPTMERLGANICFATKTFSVNPDCDVQIHKPFTIPPKAAVIKYVKTKTQLPHGFTGIFDPLNHFTNTDKLHISSNLSRVYNNKIPVKFVNHSHNFVTLSRNTHIGTFQGLEKDTTLHDVSDKPAWKHFLNAITTLPSQPNPSCNTLDKQNIQQSDNTNTHSSPNNTEHHNATPINAQTPQPPPINPSEAAKKILTLIDLSKCNLTPAERQELENLIIEFIDIFSTPQNMPTGIKSDPHKLTLKPGVLPHTGRYIRCPPQLQNILAEIIQDYLNLGYIRHSNSPWTTSCILVKKPAYKNSTGPPSKDQFRLCCDFSFLTPLLVKSYFPLPKITEILEQVAGKGRKYLTSMDLESGYFQINLDESSSPITAFVANGQKYEYLKMVQGICDSGFHFQQTMKKVLANTGISPYLDDVNFGDTTFKSHIARLRLVFTRFREYNVKIKPSKFFPCRSELKILGFTCNEHGVKPCPQKVEVIQKTPYPSKKKHLRGFLGLCNFFRRHIPNYSNIAAPLYKLTSKNVKYKFTRLEQQAFDKVKQAMTESCMLVIPNFQRDFYLICDASSQGLGSFIAQMEGDKLMPIAFASRRTNKGESSLSASHLELLAIAWSLKYFSDYLKFAKVHIWTDHRPLLSLTKSFVNPNARIERYLHFIRNFDTSISYIEGKKNVVSDCLSRSIAISQDIPESEADLVHPMNYNGSKTQHCNAVTLRKLPHRQLQTPNTPPQLYVYDPVTNTHKKYNPPEPSDISIPTDDKSHNISPTPSQHTLPHSHPPSQNTISSQSTHETDHSELSEQSNIDQVSTTGTINSDDTALPSQAETHSTHTTNSQLSDTENDIKIDLTSFKTHIQSDPFYGPMYKLLKNDEKPADRNTERKIQRVRQQYVIKNDLLYFIFKPSAKSFDRTWQFFLVVPEKLRPQILYSIHAHPMLSNCHAGEAKTLQMLHSNKLHWYSQNKDVINYVKSCQPCQQYKKPKQRGAPFIPMDNSTLSFNSHVHIDLFSNLRPTPEGYTALLAICCRFSKLTVFTPVKKGTAKEIARALVDEWALVYGTPLEIISDNGQSFRSKLLQSVCKMLGVKNTYITPLRANANGAAESKFRHVKAVFSKYLDKHQDWAQLVKIAQFSYNSTPHSSLNGLSPNQVVFGNHLNSCLTNALHVPRNIPQPVENYVTQLKQKLESMHKFVKESIITNQRKVIEQKNRDRKLIQYKLGERVGLYFPTIPNKLRRDQTNKLYRPYRTH